jgi:hypothetical protein
MMNAETKLLKFLETAAKHVDVKQSEWFKKLSKASQEAYLKAHPRYRSEHHLGMAQIHLDEHNRLKGLGKHKEAEEQLEHVKFHIGEANHQLKLAKKRKTWN